VNERMCAIKCPTTPYVMYVMCVCVPVDSKAVVITPLLSGCFEGVDGQLPVVCIISNEFSRQCSCETNSGLA